jgi:site-specific DNA-methyltransferase (adenine-specific)
MAVNIEDAGFEIRDMIAWVYGSGFPKSHNIGKVVDKLQGNEREKTISIDINHLERGDKNINKQNYTRDVGVFNFENEQREKRNNLTTKGTSEWEGWGTALKPALEPITMARKPFKGTVANNVLKNGVGGINIDGCRVESGERDARENNTSWGISRVGKENDIRGNKAIGQTTQGRFPANFIHDGSDEVKDLFPYSKSTGGCNSNTQPLHQSREKGELHKINKRANAGGLGDSGSASRFFYCAKASKQDRNEGLEKTARKEGFEYKRKADREKEDGKGGENPRNRTNTEKQNHHPTVKPTDLMRYLVRLVTPKDGIVLDCFMGSGSTGKACALEGFEFVGIDLDKDYCEIAKARIDKALEDKKQDEAQQELF